MFAVWIDARSHGRCGEADDLVLRHLPDNSGEIVLRQPALGHVAAEQGILLWPFDQGRVMGLEEPGDRDTTASSTVEEALRAWLDAKPRAKTKSQSGAPQWVRRNEVARHPGLHNGPLRLRLAVPPPTEYGG